MKKDTTRLLIVHDPRGGRHATHSVVVCNVFFSFFEQLTSAGGPQLLDSLLQGDAFLALAFQRDF